MSKRWKVKVFFSSPLVDGPHLIETRLFRFWFAARIFAWSQTQWSGWKQTWAVITILPQTEKGS